MQIIKKQKRPAKGTILYIDVGEIHPSPVQPRKHFNQRGLEELAASIKEHGVLQPLSVRMRGSKYELVAGERRLRAAKIAGLNQVPCIVLNVNMEESSLIALVENLQRHDLDVIEEAEGIAQLIRMFNMSQDEAARRLGKSQSAIANKLRLLRLPSDVLEDLREAELSERHGRALLRLQTSQEQRDALKEILRRGMNVAATESYIELLLAGGNTKPDSGEAVSPEAPGETGRDKPGLPAGKPHPEEIPPDKSGGQKTLFVLKDVRIFLNSLSRGLAVMRQGGIDVGLQKEETESELVLTISIPKSKK